MSLRTQLMSLAVMLDINDPETMEPMFHALPGSTANGEPRYPELDSVLKTVSNFLLDAAVQQRDEADQLAKATHRVIPLEIAASLERLAREILERPDHSSSLTQGVLDLAAKTREDAERQQRLAAYDAGLTPAANAVDLNIW